MSRVPVVDLARRTAALEPELSEAIASVLASGVFLLGPETEAFEAEFARFCGRQHAVAVASGTEALRLALVSMGIAAGLRQRRHGASAAPDSVPVTTYVPPDVFLASTSRTRVPRRVGSNPSRIGLVGSISKRSRRRSPSIRERSRNIAEENTAGCP